MPTSARIDSGSSSTKNAERESCRRLKFTFLKEKILEAELAAEQVAHRLIFKRLDDAPMPTDGGSVKDRAEENLKLYLRRLVTQRGGPGAPDERDLGDVSSIVAAL